MTWPQSGAAVAKRQRRCRYRTPGWRYLHERLNINVYMQYDKISVNASCTQYALYYVFSSKTLKLELTQASVVCEHLCKFITVGLAVPTVAAVTPR